MIDACKPHRHLDHFPTPTLLTQSTYERVVGRWAELGFDGRPPKPAAFHPERAALTAALSCPDGVRE